MAAGPVAERNQDATIYVGGLDDKVNEALVWELFVQAGPVVNVHMPKDRVSQNHQGYGFIEFLGEDDADYAIKIMNMIKLYGKPVRVNKASSHQKNLDVGANIFIGNLDPEVDEKLLYDTFSAFGVILQTPKIMRDPDTGNSKGFAFINFASFDASDAAIEAMNGQYLCNRAITISYAFKKDSKGERHGTAAERLLASQNPLSQADKPHQVFADAPPPQGNLPPIPPPPGAPIAPPGMTVPPPGMMVPPPPPVPHPVSMPNMMSAPPGSVGGPPLPPGPPPLTKPLPPGPPPVPPHMMGQNMMRPPQPNMFGAGGGNPDNRFGPPQQMRPPWHGPDNSGQFNPNMQRGPPPGWRPPPGPPRPPFGRPMYPPRGLPPRMGPPGPGGPGPMRGFPPGPPNMQHGPGSNIQNLLRSNMPPPPPGVMGGLPPPPGMGPPNMNQHGPPIPPPPPGGDD